MRFRISTLILLFVLVSIIAYTWVNREEIISPCLPPLHYRVGEVDTRFNISKEKFTELVSQSKRLWEDALGKNVFVYDSQATFTINLFFDERQSKTNQSIQLEKEINAKKETYDTINEKLNATSQTYETLTHQYTIKMKVYEKELDTYNEEVARWNKIGSISKEDSDNLKKKAKNLENQRSEINALVHQINALAGTSKETATSLNALAETINTHIETHNTLFEDGEEEFNKGLFERDTINLYQFITQEDLLMTLLHEMGHALFITEHTTDPQSIMYYLLKDQPTQPITLTKQDIDSANQSCRFTLQTPMEILRFLLLQFSEGIKELYTISLRV